jgi:FkbM family methyltransferase
MARMSEQTTTPDDHADAAAKKNHHGPRRSLTRQVVDGAMVLTIAIVVVGAIWWKPAPSVDWYEGELKPFQREYGPQRSSLAGEEWFVRDFFHDRRGGVFVDIGAYDYKRDSNTYYLETVLGWSGVAVDANPAFAPGYQQFRPRTRFVNFFVSDHSDGRATLFVPPSNDQMASSTQDFANNSAKRTTQSREVPTITLNDLLRTLEVEHIDFLTVDVELAEPMVLAGFDARRYRPTLVCIEAHPRVRQQIINYFARAGYVVVGKYLRADLLNLWFTPLQ